MAAKRTMLWLLVWRALRLRFQRVSVVFAALMVGGDHRDGAFCRLVRH
ncbi:putative ABC transporter permease component [Escherichia coli]|nr:putative ABC transporter permease component [Escherichia coli]